MNKEINLEFFDDDGFSNIKNTNCSYNELIRIFLLDVRTKIAFKVIRKIISKKRGALPVGEFLTMKVENENIIIRDDFDLDLDIDFLEMKSKKILFILKDWESFLKKQGELI